MEGIYGYRKRLGLPVFHKLSKMGLYHVFYQKSDFRTKVEFSNNHYYEHEEEFAANLFAGMLLMPEASFRFMYTKFKDESKNDEKDTVIRLMNYYQVPYMAVLIRCYELGL